MIKAILFDFDGVLTTDATGSESICNYICMKTGLNIKIFEKEYFKYNDDLLYGKTTHEEIWKNLCEGLNTQIDMNILYESFINTPIDNQMMKLIDGLKKQNYKVGMVTDNKKIAYIALFSIIIGTRYLMQLQYQQKLVLEKNLIQFLRKL